MKSIDSKLLIYIQRMNQLLMNAMLLQMGFYNANISK